jgi:hypothetical protein
MNQPFTWVYEMPIGDQMVAEKIMRFQGKNKDLNQLA